MPLAVAVWGAGSAALALSLNALRVDVEGWRLGHNQRLWTLLTLGGAALAIGSMIAAAAAALSLLRARRSAGAALTVAAFGGGALVLVVQLVATWSWPLDVASRGWRLDALVVGDWVRCAVPVLATIGLCAAGWADRGVRLIAPGAIGAALLAVPPPPLVSWAHSWIEHGAWRWDVDAGAYVMRPDGRMWIVPALIAVGGLAWAAGTAVLVLRQPAVPTDAVAPRSPAPALRRFAVASVVMPIVAVAAGLAIALAQGQPASETRLLAVLIPVAVGAASALVALSLLAIAGADVAPAASRRCTAAAILILWCVAVVAAQTLWSQRPEAPSRFFTVFEAPWMPGMVGAAFAVLALLCIASALAVVARQAPPADAQSRQTGAGPRSHRWAGQPASRHQGIIVVLALVIGAATAPWVLGFGTRELPLDPLRVATLASAAIINLGSWLALARTAWRLAAALDRT